MQYQEQYILLSPMWDWNAPANTLRDEQPAVWTTITLVTSSLCMDQSPIIYKSWFHLSSNVSCIRIWRCSYGDIFRGDSPSCPDYKWLSVKMCILVSAYLAFNIPWLAQGLVSWTEHSRKEKTTGVLNIPAELVQTGSDSTIDLLPTICYKLGQSWNPWGYH